MVLKYRILNYGYNKIRSQMLMSIMCHVRIATPFPDSQPLKVTWNIYLQAMSRTEFEPEIEDVWASWEGC